MFDALSKLSNAIPDAYHRASEFKDLHLGDLHLIKIDGLLLSFILLFLLDFLINFTGHLILVVQTMMSNKTQKIANLFGWHLQSHNLTDRSVKSHVVAFRYQTLNVAWPKLHSPLLRNQV